MKTKKINLIFALFLVSALLFFSGCSFEEDFESSTHQQISFVEKVVVEDDIKITLIETHDYSIKEIAELYDVDPYSLLEAIVFDHGLEKSYCIDCTLTELNKEKHVSAAELRDLAEAIRHA